MSKVSSFHGFSLERAKEIFGSLIEGAGKVAMVGYGVAAHAKGQIAKHAKESGVTDALKDKYDQKGKIIEDGGKFAKDSASYLYSGAKGGIAYASEGGGKGYAFALDGAKRTYEFL